MKEFNEIATEELIRFRNDFRDYYTWMEESSRKKYGKKTNYLDRLASDLDLLSGNEKEILELIKIDYIKSHSNNFEVRPPIKSATDFLRKILLDQSIEPNYDKRYNYAILELLKQIRDNLVHQGKFEVDQIQYERNYVLIKNGTIILKRITILLEDELKKRTKDIK